MKPFAALFMLAFAVLTEAPRAQLQYFQYERPIGAAAVAGQACVVLHPQIFEHAAAQLADLRLYRDTVETPYVLRVSTPGEPAQKLLTPLNLGLRGRDTVFDAAMPEGSYSDLDLSVAGQDFIATVSVTGSHVMGQGTETKLGSFTIFDLTGQKLGRSTVLHLPPSDFLYLHLRITGPLAPAQVAGVSVERAPAAQPRYVAVAETSQVEQRGHASVVEFTVPAHVPVDRLTFVPPQQPVSFSRAVAVTIAPSAPRPVSDAVESPQTAQFAGSLLRVHAERDGHRIDEERLDLDAVQTFFDTPARWTIRIDNADDAALIPQEVRLEMLQRTVCYEAMPGAIEALYYGDSVLNAPHYDYATLFAKRADAATSVLGPEQANGQYRARPDARPFTERHPALLWLALVAVIALLGGLAVRSANSAH